MTTDPAPVECSVTIEATPEVVFPYFTDPRKIVDWMGSRATLSPEPGGIYRVECPFEMTARGEFVEVDPPRRVVFTWGWEGEGGMIGPGESTVEVELVPLEGATRVQLRHFKLEGTTAERHEVGWVHYLGRLTVAAAGGDAGPDLGPQPDAG